MTCYKCCKAKAEFHDTKTTEPICTDCAAKQIDNAEYHQDCPHCELKILI